MNSHKSFAPKIACCKRQNIHINKEQTLKKSRKMYEKLFHRVVFGLDQYAKLFLIFKGDTHTHICMRLIIMIR